MCFSRLYPARRDILLLDDALYGRKFASWRMFKCAVYSSTSASPLEPQFVRDAPKEAHEVVRSSPFALASSVDGSSAVTALQLSEYARAIRSWGHLLARIDPLDLPKRAPFHRSLVPGVESRLDFSSYGLNPAKLKNTVGLDGIGGLVKRDALVGDVIAKLHATYCGDLGFEFMHVTNSNVVDWFIKRIECTNLYDFTEEERLSFFEQATRGVLFERSCAKSFPTCKRFGCDGLEALNNALDVFTNMAIETKASSLVLAMAHRGRLNVLANIMGKPLEHIYSEFRHKTTFDAGFSGDVKYHFGYSCNRHGLQLELLNNPSHLEFVVPLLIGKTRAKIDAISLSQLQDSKDAPASAAGSGHVGQFYPHSKACDYPESKRVVPVCIHGDAAICGEGIVYEIVQMSQIPGYRVGGCIHVVTNNQIGFTAYPIEGASARYATDVAKVIEAPVIHVNAHNVEAVVAASRIAFDYRAKFGGDVFVDLVGFRRFGHNELDMPKFTNAEMYAKVAAMPTVSETYREYLLRNGFTSKEKLDEIHAKIEMQFTEAIKASITAEAPPKPKSVYCNTDNASKCANAAQLSLETLHELGAKLVDIPQDIKLHNAVANIFKSRRNALLGKGGVDFGFSEALAYSTLAEMGYRVRLSGQDSVRGTFSHRHANVQCQNSFKYYGIFTPLKNGHRIRILNSLLSETAALGYEYGYSLDDYNTLSIWEAQFGDFCNVAQPIVDEFIASAETKWAQESGLCLFLPHGFDGQGPDHSSGRIERFLQLSNESDDLSEAILDPEVHAKRTNIFVLNCTITSNLYHALVLQMKRPYRKPTIFFTGKRTLKLRGAASPLNEFGPDHKFRPYIIDDGLVPNEQVEMLCLCSGQVYFDLRGRLDQLVQESSDDATRESGTRAHIDARKIAIARVEQLTPVPAQEMLKHLQRLPNLKRLVWCQEEHCNAGAWHFMQHRLLDLIGLANSKAQLNCAARPPLAAPSCGSEQQHKKEHEALLKEVFG